MLTPHGWIAEHWQCDAETVAGGQCQNYRHHAIRFGPDGRRIFLCNLHQRRYDEDKVVVPALTAKRRTDDENPRPWG